ncbi:uncharacterized protein SCHCODRAFT_01037142 [Schizophyllum commune H4-8]|uniref:Expressed protein n=1 Tax=Schizophyllum commune (strain H4-8 / FGSC 9210) TaxID=578458 RepID=D8PQ55_SCHCM|nr:uncharacterized protein SCHCODRAFT_01037142 [Schizophyllum commune H4-8]KAI5898279.1 hypothetical protein SCHCODRAFT_01037142 [Schizophyllum commune H4-8]
MYRPAKARLRAEGLGVDEGQATPDESPLIPDLLSANLAAVVGDTSMYDDESEEGSSESVRNGSSDHRSWAGTWDDRTGRNYQRSVAPSLEPPSAMGTVSGSIRIMDGNPVFVGDPESDWVRCRAAMHRLKRDGRILEVWRKWLGQSQPAKPLRGNAVARQPTRSSSGISRPGPARSGQVNSDVVEPGDVPLEYVRAVLDEHILDVLQLFVYPDTKARFLDLLAMVGILPRLSMNLESIMDQTEFWSYSEGLNLAGTSSSPGGSKSA